MFNESVLKLGIKFIYVYYQFYFFSEILKKRNELLTKLDRAIQYQIF